MMRLHMWLANVTVAHWVVSTSVDLYMAMMNVWNGKEKLLINTTNMNLLDILVLPI